MIEGPISLRGVELAAWQVDAVEAWRKGDGRPHTGTLEIFTGGGKTLMALACIARASEVVPDLRVAIVVPSEALARQWREVLLAHTTLTSGEIGLMGAGGRDSFGLLGTGPRVLVAVLNSAAKKLAGSIFDPDRTMLVVDECHRAGAPKFSKVLEARARFRLGLSATPDREELDEDGEPLGYDEQVVGRKLGRVVYRWMLSDARRIGWLPSFRIHHHGLALRADERAEYEALSRRVDEAADRLTELGFDRGRIQQLRARGGEGAEAAAAYVAATSARKDLLYRAAERRVLAVRLVHELLDGGADRRIILFHERIDEAIELFDVLASDLDVASAASRVRPVVEHSRLPDRDRQMALHRFRTGEANVLVSVKSLVEGIDVPAADVGISVASSSSVRQRIQSLGRVLRRRFDDPEGKQAEMHVVYMRDTVDEVIYGKQDWSDITGDGTNTYWKWSLDEPPVKEQLDGPPRTPKPTEDMEWKRLGGRVPERPTEWLGEFIGQEYSVDTMGTVTNPSKTVIANPQGVGRMLEVLRGRPGGRFRVTPLHRLVLAWGDDRETSGVFVIGGLGDAFEALAPMGEGNVGSGSRPDRPGEPMPGLPDKLHGTFACRQRRGGVVERKVKGGVEWAVENDADNPVLAANAVHLLQAWRVLGLPGITFHVSSDDDAWYIDAGVPRFLSRVPGGFSWPA